MTNPSTQPQRMAPVIQFLSMADLERVTTFHRRTIDRWIRDGAFPPGRIIGGARRIWTPDEVAEWQQRALAPPAR